MNLLNQLLAAAQTPFGTDPAAFPAYGNIGAAYMNQMGQRGAAMSGRLASDLRSWTDALAGLGQARMGSQAQLGIADRQETGKHQRLGHLTNMFAGLWKNMNSGTPAFGRGFGVNFGNGQYGGVV